MYDATTYLDCLALDPWLCGVLGQSEFLNLGVRQKNLQRELDSIEVCV